MDSIELLANLGVLKITWVYDRVTTVSIPPRFVGRPITFDYYESEDEDDYASTPVTGTLEAVVGSEFWVSGDVYNWGRMANTKVWRKVIKNGD